MLHDVYCMQDHGYVVFMEPLEVCEADAKERSEKNPDLDYFIVKADDTPIVHYKAGKRTELEAVNG